MKSERPINPEEFVSLRDKIVGGKETSFIDDQILFDLAKERVCGMLANFNGYEGKIHQLMDDPEISDHLTVVVLGRILSFGGRSVESGDSETDSFRNLGFLRDGICSRLGLESSCLNLKTLIDLLNNKTDRALDSNFNSKVEENMKFIRNAAAAVISN